jgi:predicted phage terminase large subunit-like protein
LKSPTRSSTNLPGATREYPRLESPESARVLETFWIFCQETKVLEDLCEQPHKEMCDELEEMVPVFGGWKQHKKIYLAPRGSFKTSLVKAFIIYCYLKFPNIRIVYGRATHKAAMDVLRSTKEMLTQNPVIRSIWGDFEETSTVWSDSKVVLIRTDPSLSDPTIDLTSLGGNLTGCHPDLIILDDLVTDNNYRSAATTERTRVLLNSAYPVLQPGGSIIVCGTRWSYDDVYGWLMEQDDEAQVEEDRSAEIHNRPPRNVREWGRYIRSVYLEDGSLYFPDRITEEFLEQQKRSLRTQGMLFTSWYYNQPYEEGTKLFPTDILRYFEADYWRSPGNHLQFADGRVVPVYVSMTIDPAPTVGPSSDFTGITVVGCDADSRWYVLWAEAMKKLPTAGADHVVSLIIRYAPTVCGIESDKADPEFVSRIRQRLMELGIDCAIQSYSAIRDEAPGERGKGQRIEALEPYFREGVIWLRRGAPMRDLLQQLNRYGAGLEHDDVLDALAMQRLFVRTSRERTKTDLVVVQENVEEKLSWGPDGPPKNEVRSFRGSWVGRGSQIPRSM